MAVLCLCSSTMSALSKPLRDYPAICGIVRRRRLGSCRQVAPLSSLQDQVTGAARGFGFVHFPDPAQAHAGMIALNNSDLAGRHIYVRIRTAKGARSPTSWTNTQGAARSRPVMSLHASLDSRWQRLSGQSHAQNEEQMSQVLVT